MIIRKINANTLIYIPEKKNHNLIYVRLKSKTIFFISAPLILRIATSLRRFSVLIVIAE